MRENALWKLTLACTCYPLCSSVHSLTKKETQTSMFSALTASWHLLASFSISQTKQHFSTVFSFSRSLSSIHLMKTRSMAHLWFILHSKRDLKFWLWTIKAKGRESSPSQFKNKNFPRERKRSMNKLGWGGEEMPSREFKTTVYHPKSSFSRFSCNIPN